MSGPDEPLLALVGECLRAFGPRIQLRLRLESVPGFTFAMAFPGKEEPVVTRSEKVGACGPENRSAAVKGSKSKIARNGKALDSAKYSAAQGALPGMGGDAR